MLHIENSKEYTVKLFNLTGKTLFSVSGSGPAQIPLKSKNGKFLSGILQIEIDGKITNSSYLVK